MRFKTLLLLLLVSATAFARPQMREVVRDSIVNAPFRDVLLTANRFCYEFQACPDSLFEWAYLGLDEAEIVQSSSKESRDVIQLRYKDRVYDPVNKTGDVAIDIYVLGVRWWKNQHLGTKYVLSRPAKSKYPMTAKMTATYSGSILEGGTVLMRMEPVSETQTSVHYEFRLVFAKVLSAFISDKTWQNAIEWRLSTIFDNLVEYAETGTVTPKEKGPRR